MNIKLLFDIFITFFKLGCFSFGGGYAIIPLIEREVTQIKAWLKKEDLTDVLAIAGALPGAIALNASAFVGYNVAGVAGAIVALLGNLIPSVVISFTLIALFVKSSTNEWLQKAFYGIRPAVVGLIAFAGIKMIRTSIKDYITLIIALIAFVVALFVPSIPIPAIILSGAILGIVIFILRNVISKEARK